MPGKAGYAPIEHASISSLQRSASWRATRKEGDSDPEDTVGLVASPTRDLHPRPVPAAARRRWAWRVALPVGLVLVALLSLSLIGSHGASAGDQIVILVSCDGFRADYRYRAGPVMRRLLAEGVQAEFMRPAFPSKTFPNHWSLATGLWPESHGIVGNSFIEPSTGEVFSMRSKQPFFWRGEPLWVTAEKAGVRSAPAMWPGADVNLSGIGAPGDGLPSYALPYTPSIDKTQRVSWVLEQLARSVETQPRFLTLYMEDMDDAGHRHGPDSPEVAAAILDVDGALQALFDGLEKLRLETRRRVNIVVVGDHGMVGTNSDRYAARPILTKYLHSAASLVA
jgi:predicted AlkP superfamily pyrophosphatase or phosphodiesterase